jgi:hypothetical protein
VGGALQVAFGPLSQLHGRRHTRGIRLLPGTWQHALACTCLSACLPACLPACSTACLPAYPTSSALQRRAKLTEIQTAEMIKTAAQVGDSCTGGGQLHRWGPAPACFTAQQCPRRTPGSS